LQCDLLQPSVACGQRGSDPLFSLRVDPRPTELFSLRPGAIESAHDTLAIIAAQIVGTALALLVARTIR
jgi:hypothetical protein